MAKPTLEEIAIAERGRLLPNNLYTEVDQYSVGNDRALSDGDKFGKGYSNGSIGSSVDIAKRTEQLKVNDYNEANQYGFKSNLDKK